MPRPVCTLNGADESAMNRPNVGPISLSCSNKNKYYKAFTALQDHACTRLIRALKVACNPLPSRCRASRTGSIQDAGFELRRTPLLRSSVNKLSSNA